MRFATKRGIAAAALAVIALACGPATGAAAACPAPGDAYSAAVLADSPSAYYRLDDASGPTLCDSSSAATNGTYMSAGVSFGVAGALLSSPDSSVQVGAPSTGIGDGGPGVTGDHSFTFEGWFRSTGTAQTQILVDMGVAATGRIAGLGISQATGSSLLLDTYNGVIEWPTGPTNLWDQQWHQLVVTYEAGGEATGFVDGRSLGPKPTPHTLNLGASEIRLGWWVDHVLNSPFVGGADEIAVYPSALSPSRVLAHFAASRPGAPGTAQLPINSFVVTVPRVTCAGVCHVITVSVRVLGPGTVTVSESLATGGGALAARTRGRHVTLVASARVTAARPGTFAVKLKTTRAGQRALRSKRKLALKLRVTFAPSGGHPISKTLSVTIRA